MLNLKLQYFGHLMRRADSSEKTLMLGKIEGRRRRGWQRWDGYMASVTQWTCVWASSRSQWWTGKPDMLQSMGSQRVGHDWSDLATAAAAFFMVQLSHPYMTTGKTVALTRQTFVYKVMSLLFNMLSRLVLAFLPRSKCLLISSAVILCCVSSSVMSTSLRPHGL